jgi:hypothetical protein
LTRSKKVNDEFVESFNKEFEIKDLRSASYILENNISYGNNGTIRNNQETFIKTIFHNQGMMSSNSSFIPIDSGYKEEISNKK